MAELLTTYRVDLENPFNSHQILHEASKMDSTRKSIRSKQNRNQVHETEYTLHDTPLSIKTKNIVLESIMICIKL